MSGLTSVYNNATATLFARRFDNYGGMVSGYPLEVPLPGNYTQVDQLVRGPNGEEILAMGTFDFDEDSLAGEPVNYEDQIKIGDRVFAIAMVRKEDLRGAINRTRVFLR
jgi:hypothetical protein